MGFKFTSIGMVCLVLLWGQEHKALDPKPVLPDNSYSIS